MNNNVEIALNRILLNLIGTTTKDFRDSLEPKLRDILELLYKDGKLDGKIESTKNFNHGAFLS